MQVKPEYKTKFFLWITHNLPKISSISEFSLHNTNSSIKYSVGMTLLCEML